MKRFNQYLAYLAVFALFFTSCSKDDSGVIDSETAKLSFGAIVNDLAASSDSRQALGDYPACSTDDPAYVRIVLLQGDTEVVGTSENPYRVDLAPGEIFTVEDPELELTAGEYILDYFAVYNSAGNIIWLAPRGGEYASFVDTPLPLAIDLRGGVKKYVDVNVLCFDNRDVNLYGYQFFEIDTNSVVDFCFFANYCTEEGKHYPARYRLDVWLGTNENGTVLYSNRINTTDENDDGDFFARSLCVALPVNEGNRNEDYIYYQLTLLDWDENYGDVETEVITGTLSLADIEANFGDDGEVEYEHLRFGCGDDNGNGGVVDSDGDGIPDNIDNCPNEPGPASNNGCPEETDGDEDGDGVPDSIDQCENTPPGTEVDEVGCPVVTDGDEDGDGVPDSIDQCENTPPGTEVDEVGCPVATDGDEDGDGVPDSIDQCENTPPGTEVDEVGCPVVTDGDEDGDGVPDSIDQCENTPPGTEVDEVGCPVDTGITCEIEEADAGCSVALLEGTTNWTTVSEPGESPEFFALLSGGEPVASVTITVSGGNVAVIANMGFDFVLDDYLIEVSQNADGTGSVCVAVNDVAPVTGEDPDLFEIIDESTSFSYPVYVRITANVCD